MQAQLVHDHVLSRNNIDQELGYESDNKEF